MVITRYGEDPDREIRAFDEDPTPAPDREGPPTTPDHERPAMTPPADHEPYWLIEGHTIDVDVPIEAAMEYGGAVRTGDQIRTTPPAVAPAADLVWGRFRLGRFVMDGLAGSMNRGDIAPHYVATLRRVEQAITPPGPEPLNDDFALWLKRARDEYTRDTVSWRVVNALLDEYRDHRATGEPLSRPASGPHSQED